MRKGRPITRDHWPAPGPHRELLEHFDRIHTEHQLPSLNEIVRQGKMNKLGLERTRVNDILLGKSLPFDDKQAAALARSLGGRNDEADRAVELFRAVFVDQRMRSADAHDSDKGRASGPKINGRLATSSADDELDRIADLLAVAMSEQWSKAATERVLREPAPLDIRWRQSAEPVVGPVPEATRSRTDGSSFGPLPGMVRTTPGQLREGGRDSLLKVYGGLPSGRLVIVGGPGTGKSSAAVLLLLDALHHRVNAAPDQRRHIPVPVLFTLRDWDPVTTPVNEWLSTKLIETPLLRGRRGRRFAQRLVEHERIAVFLDGLDEMPEATRTPALQALSEQATFRLVLLSRTAELTDAAQRHTLTSAVAVELQPLAAAEAARYLLRPFVHPAPRPWQALTDTLTRQQDSAIARALSKPLDITLIRDIYGPSTALSGIGAVDELLDTTRFPDADAITRHLLDHTVPAAYISRPGQPPAPYTAETARRTLSHIARRLNAQNNNRDLAWWTIAAWIPSRLRTTISVIGGMALGGLSFGLASLMISGFRTWPITWLVVLWYSLILGLPASLAVALAFNLTTGRASTQPDIGHRARLRRLGQVCAAVTIGTGLSLAIGVIIGGWSLSVSTFLFDFAVAYGIAARMRGRATLNSLSVGRGLRSVRRLTSALLLSLAFGIADGLFGVISLLIHGAGDLAAALEYGLGGVIACLAIITPLVWLTGAFTDGPTSGSTDPTGPVEAWRDDFRLWFTVGLVFGIASGINGWLAYQGPVYGIGDERVSVLADALAGGVAMGIATGVILGRAWMTTVTQIWFATRYRTPLRLMRFLEDSRKRHLLRTVGPIYQFRHATFQDHLAGHPPTTSNPTARPGKHPDPERETVPTDRHL